MSEAKHTPGPWRCSGPDEFGDYTIQGPVDALAIAAVTNGSARALCGEGREHTANAHLITAAPDMYQEIETALAYLEAAGYGQMPEKDVNRHPEHYMVKGFRAVLAKARAA